MMEEAEDRIRATYHKMNGVTIASETTGSLSAAATFVLDLRNRLATITTSVVRAQAAAEE
jgi:hypothetical protein